MSLWHDTEDDALQIFRGFEGADVVGGLPIAEIQHAQGPDADGAQIGPDLIADVAVPDLVQVHKAVDEVRDLKHAALGGGGGQGEKETIMASMVPA